MTPKQKAVQLINKFSKMEKYSASDTAAFDINLCKKCSEIVVDEILKLEHDIDYWNQVKSEIDLY